MKRYLMISTATADRGETGAKIGFAHRLIGAAACLFALVTAGVGQVTEAWVARYNGLGNGEDRAYALAVDTAGNVYVTGESSGAGTYGDYATVKYDSNGNQLWLSRYNGSGNLIDRTTALSTDGAGNVYVTGYSYGAGTGYDYATIKYDSNGNQMWASRYHGAVDDYARALAVDAAGNVYVTGNSWGAETYEDYATVKYDSNGNELWVGRYNGPGNISDVATALAVDGAGSVYVTGYSIGAGTNTDYATMKYDSSGEQQWVARYNGPVNGGDYATAVALDAGGNIHVTGYSYGAGTSHDYSTVKYDLNGNQLWIARYSGPGKDYDFANSLAVDATGNVYVTGVSKGAGTTYDFATVKYDPNGIQLWVARYNGPGSGEDGAYALAVDAAGNVYVTGPSWGAGTGNDYATIKYDSDGNQSGSLVTTDPEPVRTVLGDWP